MWMFKPCCMVRTIPSLVFHHLATQLKPPKGRSTPCCRCIFPKGDTETKTVGYLFPHRKLLPFPQNTSASGTRKDSVCVDIAREICQNGICSGKCRLQIGMEPNCPYSGRQGQHFDQCSLQRSSGCENSHPLLQSQCRNFWHR